jgi:hypothetical protein
VCSCGGEGGGAGRPRHLVPHTEKLRKVPAHHDLLFCVKFSEEVVVVGRDKVYYCEYKSHCFFFVQVWDFFFELGVMGGGSP